MKLTLAIAGALMMLATALAYAAPFAYFVTPSGSLLIVDSATNTLAGTVAIGANPFAAAVNSAGTQVYATNFGGGSVSVIDTSTKSFITTIPVAAGPQGVALNPAGTRANVASFTAGVVPVIDTGTNAVITNIPLNAAVDVIVNPAGTRLYASNGTVVSVIDPSTNSVIDSVPLGTTASAINGVAVTPDGAHVYAATASGVLSIDPLTTGVVTVLPDSVRALGHFIGPAAFATFVVTNNNDSGPGSLRDAVAQANATVGPTTITFDPAVTGTITLTSGALLITGGALTIFGPGAANLTIDGNASDRIFLIFESSSITCPALTGPNDYLVTISGLTLTNAQRHSDHSGGAISTGHSLVLSDVIIQNSMAKAGGGVGFFAQYPGQSLAIANSQFINNVAKPLSVITTGNGGAALFVGEFCSGTRTTPVTVTITNSVFGGNSVQPTTFSGNGGAIDTFGYADITIADSRIFDNQVNAPNPPVANQVYRGGGLYGTAKTLAIVRSEISGNFTTDVTAAGVTRGGGIGLFNNAADLQGPGDAMAVSIINSTISGNTDTASGGGMWVSGNVAVNLDNSTISNNTAAPTNTGGIRITTGATSPTTGSNASPPTLTVVSSIVANNTSDDIATNLATIPTFTLNMANSLVGSPKAPRLRPRRHSAATT